MPVIEAKAGSPEKLPVRRSFGLAASTYDSVAGLQRRMGEELVEELKGRAAKPRRIVDIGAGTGYPSHLLAGSFPGAELVLLDIAETMLGQARRSRALGQAGFVCADADALPFAASSVDVLFSNLALQWCPDLARTLGEMKRVLAPGGIAAISLFVEGTLVELAAAWSVVDDRTHVNEFVSLAGIRASAAEAGFCEIGLRPVRIPVRYESVHQLMRELKGLGARNATRNRPRQLTGKQAMSRMIAAYEAAMEDGHVVATYEIVTCLFRCLS
jgi:malonyl-CoA O-methyltransferase